MAEDPEDLPARMLTEELILGRGFVLRPELLPYVEASRILREDLKPGRTEGLEFFEVLLLAKRKDLAIGGMPPFQRIWIVPFLCRPGILENVGIEPPEAYVSDRIEDPGPLSFDAIDGIEFRFWMPKLVSPECAGIAWPKPGAYMFLEGRFVKPPDLKLITELLACFLVPEKL